MEKQETIVSEKGSITISEELRRAAGIKPRDRVRLEIVGDVISIRRVPSAIVAGFGSVPPSQQPEDFGRVRELFEQGVADEVMSER